MARIPSTLAAVSAVALTFALAACGGGGSGGTGGTGDPTPAPEATSAGAGADGSGCFVGNWDADLNDLAAQVGAQLAGSGLAVTSSTSVGTQVLTVDPSGALTVVVDMTFTIAVDMSDGLQMQIDQHHTGQAGADWAWDSASNEASGIVTFSNFTNSAYHVDNTVSINGQSGGTTVPIDVSALADSPMHAECTGDTLVTTQTPSPFHTTWHRVG